MKALLHSFLAVALCLVVPITAIASQSGYGVMYDGGSLSSVKTGSKIRLFLEGDKVRFTQDGNDLIVIPAASITEISYGQDVHRRVGAAIGVASYHSA